jgi:hypothetical protein
MLKFMFVRSLRIKHNFKEKAGSYGSRAALVEKTFNPGTIRPPKLMVRSPQLSGKPRYILNSQINAYFAFEIVELQPMQRSCFLVCFLFTSIAVSAQQYSMSLGLHTGIILPYTLDQGIDKDPRYKGRYNVEFAPIGFSYSMDYEGFGLLLGGSLINIGQDYYIVNTSGGQNGIREIDLQYLNVPVGLKVHIIDLAFFKISAVASVSGAFLLKGEETVSHSSTKLRFPTEVYPILPDGYVIEYDGVLTPDVDHYTMLKKDDFRPVQVFAAVGFRSDWDVSDNWRVVFDFRANYGIFDPRTDDYLERLENNETLYDLPGKRRDMFAQLSVGISRYIDIEKSDRDRKKKLKGNSRKYVPKSMAPKRSRPKG